MNKQNSVSFDELNYFIDNQLTRSERAKVLDVLNQDEVLSKSLCELQRNDEFVLLSYSHIPEPKNNPYLAATKPNSAKLIAMVASVLIILSASISWQLQSLLNNNPQENIMNLSQLGDGLPKSNKVLIHISQMDANRISLALDKTEQLLANNNKVQVEIIANTSGLAVFRENSPYAARIHTLATQYSNVKFKACGLAIQAAKLTEGHDIKLLPEAEKVPAALDEILNHLKDNWVYFKA